MDPNTAKVAIQLQLDDINELLNSLYDGEELPAGDARTTFEAMRSDLQQQLAVLEGEILALRIPGEGYENRLAFTKILEEEKRAVSDRQLAMRLAGLAVSDSVVKRSGNYDASLCHESDTGNEEQWELAKELYAAAFGRDVEDCAPLDDIWTIKADEEKDNGKSKVLGSKVLTKCNVCLEVFPSENTLTLECKPEMHAYCRSCLIDLFIITLDNTALFPPRCCKLPIPLETCRVLLPMELIKDFDLKVEELATPNPTYCSNAECSKFIRPKDILDGVGSCVFEDCKEKTCVHCKCKAHSGLCPTDPHVQLLMDIAKRGKWQQCTNCKNMVELAHGCFHMT